MKRSAFHSPPIDAGSRRRAFSLRNAAAKVCNRGRNFGGWPAFPGRVLDSSVSKPCAVFISCIAPVFSIPKRIDFGLSFTLNLHSLRASLTRSWTRASFSTSASCTAYSKLIPTSPSPGLYSRGSILSFILSYPPTSLTTSRFNAYKTPLSIGLMTCPPFVPRS